MRVGHLGSRYGWIVGMAVMLAACSVNPATGDRQFTALMPEGQEERIGATEHEKILKQFGGPFENRALEAYVNRVGAKVATGTERPDIQYKFFVLDTPDVNAFAMPGGYIYVSRGLLALADDESQLAAVVAHEIGHITARHSAERYSQGILAGLGMAVLSAAVNDPGITRAAGLGSELALKSYSRTQEFQADELGIRYLSRAGYDPFASAKFLDKLDRLTKYDARVEGKQAGGGGYFATHPQTDDRVVRATQIGRVYQSEGAANNRDAYLQAIDGLTYGESARTGFFQGQTFIHPELGFAFTFPAGYTVQNQADKVIGVAKKTGAAVVFNGVKNSTRDPVAYLEKWAGAGRLQDIETIDVNGHPGATGHLQGEVNGQSADVRLVAVIWGSGQIYRFQLAMPSAAKGDEGRLRDMIHSLRALNAQDKDWARPLHVEVVRAGPSDNVATLAAQMKLNDPKDKPDERFRVLNGLSGSVDVKAGERYKVIR